MSLLDNLFEDMAMVYSPDSGVRLVACGKIGKGAKVKVDADWVKRQKRTSRDLDDFDPDGMAAFLTTEYEDD